MLLMLQRWCTPGILSQLFLCSQHWKRSCSEGNSYWFWSDVHFEIFSEKDLQGSFWSCLTISLRLWRPIVNFAPVLGVLSQTMADALGAKSHCWRDFGGCAKFQVAVVFCRGVKRTTFCNYQVFTTYIETRCEVLAGPPKCVCVLVLFPIPYKHRKFHLHTIIIQIAECAAGSITAKLPSPGL